jgi:fructokinase
MGDVVIVVAGEALVDLVPDGDVLRAHPGGGPFNVARTIGRLEQPVAFLGRVSRDRFGERHMAMLAEDGVDVSAVVRTEDPTTLAVAEVGTEGAATYRFYSQGTAAPGLTEVPPGGPPDALHVGTLGLALEPIATTLEALVAGSPALVMVDPNCRPGAAGDEDAYRARLQRVIASADVVKVSDDDAAWLGVGARDLLAAGPSAVLLTRGGDGAVAMTREGDVEVGAPPVDVVDTIGAGDAFGGAFLAWWRSRGLGREQLGDRTALWPAVEFACLVAARTCERAGAQPPRLSELSEASRG